MEKVGRRKAREGAFLMVFQLRFLQGLDTEQLYADSLAELEIADNEYTKKLFFGVTDNLAEIDAILEESLSNWKKDRISRVALAALRLGIYEMLIGKNNGYSICINEAVELAKRFEGGDCPSFVNGILGAVAKKHPETEEK